MGRKADLRSFGSPNRNGTSPTPRNSHLLAFLSKRLTAGYGRDNGERNLRYMRSFYLVLPNRNTPRTNISRTHYRHRIVLIAKVVDAQITARMIRAGRGGAPEGKPAQKEA